jgi:hypothetical protein
MKPSSGGGGESESEDGGGTKHKTTGTALFADLELFITLMKYLNTP